MNYACQMRKQELNGSIASSKVEIWSPPDSSPCSCIGQGPYLCPQMEPEALGILHHTGACSEWSISALVLLHLMAPSFFIICFE